MPIIKHLRKVGNSKALTLDKPILEMAGLTGDSDTVQIIPEPGKITLLTVNPQPVDPDRLQTLMNEVFRDRKAALKRLAE